MNHAIEFEVRQFPGSLDVFADTGSRDKPSVTAYGLDPDSGSVCVGLEGLFNVAVVLLVLPGNLRGAAFLSHCLDNSPRCVGWDARIVD